MKNFFKITSLCLSIFTSSIIRPEMAPAVSVADVFGGMSEEQIAEQVQMGQKFLEELEKNGSPEEKAEFEKLLVETLNSMSEQDLNDIQAIAKMVEPHIQMPEEQPKTSEPKAEIKPAPAEIKDTQNIEEFKKLINTIAQRIDDIAQKIHSSKECQEEFEVRWKNKTTFNNMKRLIQQLTHDRLAFKLTKKDLSDDEQKLIDTLKKFHKDLTQHNDTLIIEDDFGLPASFETEKKHLKQTKSIIATYNDYIDSLMPNLEKFMTKHDPEALQLAKEAEERTKKATKDATDATARKPSADARATTTSGVYRTTPAAGQGYQDYGSSYPSEYADQGYSPYGSSYGTPSESKGSSLSGGGEQATPKAKTETAATVAPAKEEKKKSNAAASLIEDIQEHLENFDFKHEDSFVNFIQKEINDAYPLISTDPNLTTALVNQPLDQLTANNWIFSKNNLANTGFDLYLKNISQKFKDTFYDGFSNLGDVLSDIKTSMKDMDAAELTKLQTSKEFANVERRIKRYQAAFDGIATDLTNKENQNYNNIGDASEQGNYRNKHTQQFIGYLKSNIESKLKELSSTISRIKRHKKSKTS